MLDACAALLDDVGYDKLTTTLIARRADVAIGSVYQFFGDKRSVVRALGVRHLDTFSLRMAEHLLTRTPTHWWGMVDIAVDEYINMHRTVPGFRTLHFGDVVDENLLDEGRTNNDVLADRLLGLLGEKFEMADDERLALALSIAVETGDALVKLAFRRHPDGDEQILTEAKALIRDYLAKHVDGPAG